MAEKRRHPRRYMLFYSRVFDREIDKYIGFLGNITQEGLMVVSEEILKTKIDYKLRLDLPADRYPQPVFDFSARSIWSKLDADPNFYNTGFQFTDISSEDTIIIEQLVKDAHI